MFQQRAKWTEELGIHRERKWRHDRYVAGEALEQCGLKDLRDEAHRYGLFEAMGKLRRH